MEFNPAKLFGALSVGLLGGYAALNYRPSKENVTKTNHRAPEDIKFKENVTKSKRAVEDKKFTFYYFGGRGLGELTRTLFVIAGVNFENERLFALPEEGQFPENLGRLPCLKIVDGSGEYIIGQSGAINRYAAKVLGLYGANELEAAKIDTLCCHLDDISNALKKYYDYMTGPLQEDWEDVWFDTPADVTERSERRLRWYLRGMDSQVGQNGFAVGNSFTLADAEIYRKLGECCEDLEPLHYTGRSNDFMKYPMYASSNERVRKVLEEDAPNILKIVDNFGNTPQMQTWLKTRGRQAF